MPIEKIGLCHNINFIGHLRRRFKAALRPNESSKAAIKAHAKENAHSHAISNLLYFFARRFRHAMLNWIRGLLCPRFRPIPTPGVLTQRQQPKIPLPVLDPLPLEDRERCGQDIRSLEPLARRRPQEGKEKTMKALRTLRKWWREFWGPDFYWPAQVDTHRWENKTEMLRRLSSTH